MGIIMEGIDIQASYAISNQIGLLVNGALTRTQTDFSGSNNTDYTKSKFIEAGLGYFKELNENPNWLFEIYGGAGTGNYNLKYDSEPRLDLIMNRFFIQPSMVYTLPKYNLEFALASRISAADYSINRININPGNHFSSHLNSPVYRSPNFFWEPSFRFSGGFKVLTFYVSYTPSLSMTEDFKYKEIMNLNFGTRLNFNTIRRIRNN